MVAHNHCYCYSQSCKEKGMQQYSHEKYRVEDQFYPKEEGIDKDKYSAEQPLEHSIRCLSKYNLCVRYGGYKKLVKDMEVESGDIQLLCNSVTLVQTAHGDQSGDKKSDIGKPVHTHPLAETPAKGYQVQERRKGRGQYLLFCPRAEDAQFPVKDSFESVKH